MRKKIVGKKILDIRNLTVDFHMPEGIRRAVDHVSFSATEGETVGLVGESGCGKSVTALSILGLIDSPPGRIVSGQVRFQNQNLLSLDPQSIRHIRGNHISMIFQEPMTSLNPVLPIGRQVAEPLMIHKGVSKKDAYKQAVACLEQVKIPLAEKRIKDYPHQLSGGMRQRVMIAMAMICRPDLLIADEPTTALDVSIQSQILSLMDSLKDALGTSVLLITHDMGVVAQMASSVVVMYAGGIMEIAPVEDIFDRPFHPYTKGLLKSIPRMDSRKSGNPKRLKEIKGAMPSTLAKIQGCKFADRCPHVFAPCRKQTPDLRLIHNRHFVRCWLE